MRYLPTQVKLFKAILPAMLAAAILIAAAPGFAESWTGRCVGVIDGDTIKAMHQGRAVRIRLYGIDCPERRQAFSARAKQFTSEQVYGKDVTIEVKDTDRYGRTVALVFEQGRGVSVNELLISSGLAWVYNRYCRSQQCERWAGLEASARENQKGLWSHPDPVAPWEFRKRR